MSIQELALTESRSLRDQYADRTDVLDRVKALSMLPDGVHVTTEMVAAYFDVPIETIKSAVKDNRAELEANGYQALRGTDLREFVRSLEDPAILGLHPNARSLAIFTRRTVLNVGQLLSESPIALAVRTYLLDVEEIASPEVRNEAVERAATAKAQLSLLKVAEGLERVDQKWVGLKEMAVIAWGLGQEPEIDPLDVPLYVPDYLRDKGLKRKQVESVQSWFGRRVASLYEAEHGEKPGKRLNDLPNGSLRETTAWTKRDLPLFEETWDRWYAAQYSPQLALIGDA